jgi:hypothetical protein
MSQDDQEYRILVELKAAMTNACHEDFDSHPDYINPKSSAADLQSAFDHYTEAVAMERQCSVYDIHQVLLLRV